MLRENHEAGILPTMPPQITERLEKERAYCAMLVEQLAICKNLAVKQEWEQLAIHCDELIHKPESRTCVAPNFRPPLSTLGSEEIYACSRVFALCSICVFMCALRVYFVYRQHSAA